LRWPREQPYCCGQRRISLISGFSTAVAGGGLATIKRTLHVAHHPVDTSKAEYNFLVVG
jgi:hypothetical protein